MPSATWSRTRVAVHWGLHGEPDRWQPFAAAVVTAAVITTVMPLALVGLGALMHRSARGPLAAVAGGLAVFLGGVLFGGLVAQRPGQVPQAFPPQWAVPTSADRPRRRRALALGTPDATRGHRRPRAPARRRATARRPTDDPARVDGAAEPARRPDAGSRRRRRATARLGGARRVRLGLAAGARPRGSPRSHPLGARHGRHLRPAGLERRALVVARAARAGGVGRDDDRLPVARVRRLGLADRRRRPAWLRHPRRRGAGRAPHRRARRRRHGRRRRRGRRRAQHPRRPRATAIATRSRVSRWTA